LRYLSNISLLVFGDPVILTIDAEAMYLAGHKFYKAQGEIWLTDAIDIRYITLTI
jgi:putative RNA 2'-phosphotransferase